MFLLYDLVLLLASFFLVPYALIKGLPYGNSLKGVRERLGLYSADGLAALQGGERTFWVHAVSVGEVRASFPLIKALKQTYPECRIVLSGMTFTGRQIAQDAKGVDLVIFFPFDLSFIVSRALRMVKPDLVVIIETEIWPNFIRQAERRNIPLVLANGRISRKSFPRYLAIRKMMQPLLEKFSVIAMQDAACARRIKAIGAPPNLVQVTGNMKFDLPLSSPDMGDLQDNGMLESVLRHKFVWVAGSIRSGEAEIMLQCHRSLLDKGIPSFMILAPRHPQRFSDVAELLKKEDVPFLLRSQLNDSEANDPDAQVLLVDTVGELVRFYSLANAIFVGASLVPKGGHNILEPAQLGKPVLFGPHIFNFKEISRLILESGGGVKVQSGDELVGKLAFLYENENKRIEMGEAGQSLIRDNAGATEKTLSSVQQILES